MTDKTIEETRNKINEINITKTKPIPIELFCKKSRRTTPLINNQSPEASQKGENRWYDIELKEPVYISSIIVNTEDYKSYGTAEAKWSNAAYSFHSERKTKISENSFRFEINNFIDKFSFKPEKAYSGSPKILSINLTGYTREEFEDICNTVTKLDSEKENLIKKLASIEKDESNHLNKILELTNEKEEIEDSIAELKNEKAGCQTEINNLKEQSEELHLKINELESKESNIISRIETLDDSIDKKKNEQKQLNTIISKNNAELKSLKENINMFPSEITGFVDQGARSISRYTLIAAVPIAIIVIVTSALFFNAADLTVIYKEQEDFNVWYILITRIPFVIIAVTLIHSCYRIAKIFIQEIIRINHQRLNLSKISIIATDVSTASSEGLGLSEDETYQLRTKLKMELLREHLKSYIREDYEYKETSKQTGNKKTEDLETIE